MLNYDKMARDWESVSPGSTFSYLLIRDYICALHTYIDHPDSREEDQFRGLCLYTARYVGHPGGWWPYEFWDVMAMQEHSVAHCWELSDDYAMQGRTPARVQMARELRKELQELLDSL